jgi:hypothetical protein
MESLEEIRGKNKDGLSYSLIFQHGEKNESPKVENSFHALSSQILGKIFNHTSTSEPKFFGFFYL